MGLTRDESSRYQQLAAMPQEHFETAVATAKATAGEVTTAFMLRDLREPPMRERLAVGAFDHHSAPHSRSGVLLGRPGVRRHAFRPAAP